MSDALPDDYEALRKAFWVPCETLEDLHDWIHCYLGVDFPSERVDPDSNSSPMEVLWELYSAMKNNDRPDLSRLMAYASRDSYKTLAAAAMEVLVLMHLDRDVGHMAAIEAQARNSQKYVKDFFSRPILRDFVVSDNVESVEVAWYEDLANDERLTVKEWKALPEPERARFKKTSHYIKIVICTKAGANSLHVGFFCVDEVDLANWAAYEEAKSIPTERDGKPPITFLISTRKSRFGKVQDELDHAAGMGGRKPSGLVIRHWNIIDVTRACGPETHKPELPKIPIYVSDDNLEHVSEEQYNDYGPEVKKKFVRMDDQFAGCLKCPIFFACKGKLAAKKEEGPLLRTIRFVANKFREVTQSFAKAQLLCWKPDTEGLIYPNFDPEKHMIEAHEIASLVAGEDVPGPMSRADLINFLRDRGASFVTGLDHGYNHNFAVTSLAKFGRWAFIFDVQEQPGLELEDKIALLDATIRVWDPDIYPDPEDPGANATIRKKGFKTRKWNKGKGSVLDGINIMRSKIKPHRGAPTLFLLKGDPGCEHLATKLSKYHWKMNDAGKPTEFPNDVDDDSCDSTRYAVMNAFGKSGGLNAPKETREEIDAAAAGLSGPPKPPATTHNYLGQFIDSALSDGLSPTGEAAGGSPGAKKGRKGRLIWDCS